MTVRQIRRLVQQSFDLAKQSLLDDGFKDDVEQLEAATAHCHDIPVQHTMHKQGHLNIYLKI